MVSHLAGTSFVVLLTLSPWTDASCLLHTRQARACRCEETALHATLTAVSAAQLNAVPDSADWRFTGSTELLLDLLIGCHGYGELDKCAEGEVEGVMSYLGWLKIGPAGDEDDTEAALSPFLTQGWGELAGLTPAQERDFMLAEVQLPAK